MGKHSFILFTLLFAPFDCPNLSTELREASLTRYLVSRMCRKNPDARLAAWLLCDKVFYIVAPKGLSLRVSEPFPVNWSSLGTIVGPDMGLCGCHHCVAALQRSRETSREKVRWRLAFRYSSLVTLSAIRPPREVVHRRSSVQMLTCQQNQLRKASRSRGS